MTKQQITRLQTYAHDVPEATTDELPMLITYIIDLLMSEYNFRSKACDMRLVNCLSSNLTKTIYKKYGVAGVEKYLTRTIERAKGIEPKYNLDEIIADIDMKIDKYLTRNPGKISHKMVGSLIGGAAMIFYQKSGDWQAVKKHLHNLIDDTIGQVES